jgi:hypothetical protein
MDAIILAKIFGIFFSIFGLGIVAKKQHMRGVIEDTIHHPGVQLIFALVHLLIGSVIVVLHHSIVMDWTLLVTVLGYFLLVTGIFRYLFSHVWISMLHKVKDGNGPVLVGLLLMVYGLALIYFGFDIGALIAAY